MPVKQKNMLIIGGQYNYATYQLPQKPLFGSNGIARNPAIAPEIQDWKLDDSGWGAYLGYAVLARYHFVMGGLVAYDDYGHARYHILNSDDPNFFDRHGIRNIKTHAWSLLLLIQCLMTQQFNAFVDVGSALIRTEFFQVNIPNTRVPENSRIANNKSYQFSTMLPEIRLGLNWNFTQWIGIFISYTHLFAVRLSNDKISYLESEADLTLPSTGAGINVLSAGINITWNLF